MLPDYDGGVRTEGQFASDSVLFPPLSLNACQTLKPGTVRTPAASERKRPEWRPGFSHILRLYSRQRARASAPAHFLGSMPRVETIAAVAWQFGWTRTLYYAHRNWLVLRPTPAAGVARERVRGVQLAGLLVHGLKGSSDKSPSATAPEPGFTVAEPGRCVNSATTRAAPVRPGQSQMSRSPGSDDRGPAQR